MKNETTTEASIGCAILFAIIPFSAIYSGYVLSVLWAWFIVPMFHLPTLGVATAIGLALTVRYLTNELRPDSDSKKTVLTRASEAVGWAVAYPTLTLLFGYVVHLFV